MKSSRKRCSRREFIVRAGYAGAGSVLGIGSTASAGEIRAQSQDSALLKVPTRPFGKTGVEVSMLSLGGIIDTVYNQLLLDQAFNHGVTYWDTAESYLNGRSEEGFGLYLAVHPQVREKLFLVTKTESRDPDDLSRALNESLKRLRTTYVDLYFLHAVSDAAGEVDDRARKWAEQAKTEGKIKFFGFSTHDNMEQCLLDASRMGWIDGIMMTYNYRLMHTDGMKKAVDACAAAGIGLTAMKTMARSAYAAFLDLGTDDERAKQLTERFLKKGYSVEQARLKAVWENPHIASICSQLPSMTILRANVAAAVDQIELSRRDRELLQTYAQETAGQYCAGCSRNCEPALAESAPIARVMRYLMYARGYGERERAALRYAKIPTAVRERMAGIDYRAAEQACPRGLPIGRLMHEAGRELVAG